MESMDQQAKIEQPARKSNRLAVLRAGVLAAALVTPFEHGPVRDAEISAEASWQKGAQELERSAKKDVVEHGTMYVTYTDGTVGWLRTKHGEAGIITVPIKQIQAELNAAGKKVARLCDVHTHPLSTARESKGIKDVVPYSPPSGLDIANFEPDARDFGVPLKAYTYAVFDPRGVWYYRAALATDTQKDPELWQRIKLSNELAENYRRLNRNLREGMKDISSQQLDEAEKHLSDAQRARVVQAEADHRHDVMRNEIIQSVVESKGPGDTILGSLIPTEMFRLVEEMRSLSERFRKLKEQSNAASDRGNMALNEFIQKAPYSKEAFDQHYDQLKSAYLNQSTVIRFVSYEDLKNEPACAGTDVPTRNQNER